MEGLCFLDLHKSQGICRTLTGRNDGIEALVAKHGEDHGPHLDADRGITLSPLRKGIAGRIEVPVVELLKKQVRRPLCKLLERQLDCIKGTGVETQFPE